MSTSSPELLTSDNLSHGWGKVFLRLMAPGTHAAPIVLSIGGFHDGRATEDPTVRQAVDDALAAHGKYPAAVSAMTIFPYKHWLRHAEEPRQTLFDWYSKQFLPRLKARDKRNGTGTYFERMIRFQGAKRNGANFEVAGKNQLDHIIAIWHRDKAKGSRPRHSALQVACFDPVKDHTGQKLRGFPCLQQVSFSYDDDGGLAVTAYYPTQYVFDRAYGNYLGLANLGEFMAHEMGLHMVRLNCLIAHPELGNDVTKESLRDLERTVQERLAAAPVPTGGALSATTPAAAVAGT